MVTILVERLNKDVNNSIVFFWLPLCIWRLSPQLDCDVKLDETSDEVLVNMIYLTQVTKSY